jgi:hypothetical protein
MAKIAAVIHDRTRLPFCSFATLLHQIPESKAANKNQWTEKVSETKLGRHKSKQRKMKKDALEVKKMVRDKTSVKEKLSRCLKNI